MKKSRRMRWAARALALCLTGATAFAGAALFSPVTAEADSIIDGQTTTGSITINKKAQDGSTPLEGVEYTIYQVMNLTPGSTPGTYAKYQPTTDFAEILDGVTPDALGNYSAQELEELIGELADAAATPAADPQETNASGQAVFNSLPLGYYLVVETQAPEGYVTGSPFLIAVPSTNNYDGTGDGTAWVYDVTATPKNEQISISKELADEEEGAEQDGTVAVGDIVKYQITTVIPSYPEEYFDQEVTFEITDVMSDGLKILNEDPNLVKVTVDSTEETAGAGTYTLTAEPKTGEEADLTIAFAKEYIRDHGGKEVVVTYYAEVTEAAVSGKDGNTNGVTLTYNNEPGTTKKATPPTPVKVYSFDLQVEKFTEEDGTKALEGATFELYADDQMTNKIGEGTTNGEGSLAFELLDEGTYYLKETKAPAGYTLLADPIKVEITAADPADGTFTLKVNGQDVDETSGTYVSRIDAENGTAIIAVKNHKGFTLPTTGGMGIALFVIIGIAGIAAVSIVITRKTKKN